MHEKSKLAEAYYFYNRMIEDKNNRENFVHNLSAFLSASRSVLQYALEEAKVKPGGQAWYDSSMSASRFFTFFRDKRDINIHFEPVKPIAQHNITISETVHLSDSISIVIKDEKGNIIREQHSPITPETNSNPESTSVKSSVIYKFEGWNGNEDALSLCQQYIQELENFTSEGILRSFISG